MMLTQAESDDACSKRLKVETPANRTGIPSFSQPDCLQMMHIMVESLYFFRYRRWLHKTFKA